MRQIIFSFLFCVVIVTASAMVSNAQVKPTYFASKQACDLALASGNFNYYRPTYFGLHKKLAATEEVRGLESDACVDMMTVKGFQWVVQKEGEKMVFKGLNIVRREDCGNPIRDISHPKTAVEVPPTPKCPEGTFPSETPGICISEREKEKIVTKTVEVPKNVYINPCPTDAEFDGTTSWKSRLGGGWKQGVGSFLGSLALTKARGGSWGDSLESGGKGVLVQRVEQGINPSEDGVRLVIPSLQIDEEISRGKDVNLKNGVSVKWKGRRVALFRKLNEQSFRCDGFGLTRGSNLAIWTDGDSDEDAGKVHNPTDGDGIDRPGVNGSTNPGITLPVGNNGPVGGTIINGIPGPRPGINRLVEDGSTMPSNQLFNNTKTTTPAQSDPCVQPVGGKMTRVC